MNKNIMNIIETSRVKIAECFTKKITCKNYWNAHGKRIPYDPTSSTFDTPKKVELYRVMTKWSSDYIPDTEFESLELFVDGVKYSCGEIIQYDELKTKVKLLCCIGSG